MVEPQPPSGDLLGRKIMGAAREFLGEAIEGKRADALNHATGYAFSAGIDIDSIPKDKRREMNHAEMVNFFSANDFSSQVTRVIYATKDPEKKMAGYGYISRKEEDIAARARRVMQLSSGKDPISDESTIFEMNFDAPWHKGEAYVHILTDGMYDMLSEFFSKNPEANIFMYVEAADVPSDGRVLRNLGAKVVGKDCYLNNPDQEDPEENRKDIVFVLNKAFFEKNLRASGK